MMHHNPSLDRRSDEAAIAGRMVVGFGELEFLVVNLAAIALKGHSDGNIFKALYQLRATKPRMDVAFTLMEPFCAEHGLVDTLSVTRNAIGYCTQVRNQYAHCNWADDANGGLFFTDTEDSARRSDFSHDWKHVDIGILSAQEIFFGYARHWLMHLENKIKIISGDRSAVPVFPAPPIQPQPTRHNLASQRIPLWLSADEKARHLERALEAERPPSQPARPLSILKLTHEEWLAKLRKEGWTIPAPPNQASE